MLVNTSFCCPQLVPLSAFTRFSDFLALDAVSCMCLLKLSLGSKVRPKTLGFFLVSSLVDHLLPRFAMNGLNLIFFDLKTILILLTFTDALTDNCTDR